MCGLVGFYSPKRYRKLKTFLSKASKRLQHRGPDDAGLFFDEDAGVGLAHRRLSIIDLSLAGHQPMASADGKIHIIYNGEVYNFPQVRKTLTDCGYRFNSATDTEVILNAYQRWGVECLRRFVGMFAMAIWDGRTRCFFLARDRLGIKPLYYHLHEGSFLFASELKALMEFGAVNREIDPEAVPLFLHYQYIPAPRTVFKNTWKLMPGTYLVYDGQNLSVEPYWSIPEPSPENRTGHKNEDEALEKLEFLASQAVSDRLISDVPLGALLSGGIDSSLVVALMQKLQSSPVKTFSIGFEEPGYDEAPYASNIARFLGTNHTEMYVTPADALNVVPMLPDIYDEPFADSSGIPSLLVCRLARSKLTVALSGDGGDEQFAGYARYWSTKVMADRIRHLPYRFRAELAGLLARIPSPWISQCYLPLRKYLPKPLQVGNFADKWQKLILQLSQNDLAEFYRTTVCLWSRDDLRRLTGGPPLPGSHFEQIFDRSRHWPVMSRLMRVDQGTYLPDCMLTKIDRASMAVSLEVRVPLLDHRVVEFSASLPEHLKYRNGSGKYLVKKMLANYLPSNLFERPKMGFGIPIDQWLRGPLESLLRDFLSPKRLRDEGLFAPDFVSKTIEEHMSGRSNHQYRLWSLLMWQMWRERWLGACL